MVEMGVTLGEGGREGCSLMVLYGGQECEDCSDLDLQRGAASLWNGGLRVGVI